MKWPVAEGRKASLCDCADFSEILYFSKQCQLSTLMSRHSKYKQQLMFPFPYLKRFEVFPRALSLAVGRSGRYTAAWSVLFSSPGPLNGF